MNTPQTSRSAIGLIALPELAQLLMSVGFRVVGGTADWRGSAREVRESGMNAADLPVIAAGTPQAGLKSWLDRLSGAGRVVVLRSSDSDIGVPGGGQIQLPAALATILEQAGLPGDGGRYQVLSDFSVAPISQELAALQPESVQESPTATGWPDELDEEPEELSEPATPPTDPWGDATEPGSHTGTQPQAPADPWGQPAPSPTAEAAAPDPWGEPAPAAANSTPHPSPEAPAAQWTDEPAPATNPWGDFGDSPTADVEPEPPTPPASARSAPRPAPVYDDDELDPLFAVDVTSQVKTSQRTPIRRGSGRAPVICVFAGRGGVGKTSTAINLAERFASRTGQRASLVDMNRGQSSVRKLLRLPKDITSIYDAATAGDPRAGLLTPDQVTAARHRSLPPVSFGTVLAPMKGQADPRLVTTGIYRQAIDLCRASSDLVTIDTQIMEAFDTSGLIDGIVIPLLADPDGWGVAITDGSGEGVSTLKDRLQMLRAASIPPDRLLMINNRIEEGSQFAGQDIVDMFADYARFVGTIPADPEIQHETNRGNFVAADSVYTPILDKILHRITGFEAFEEPEQDSGRGGLLSSLFRRKGRR